MTDTHRQPGGKALFGLFVILATLSRPALAHEPPRIYDALWNQDGTPHVLMMNWGALFPVGDGTYQMMCHEMLDIILSDRASVAFGPDGSILAVTSVGLQTSSDRGCSWEFHPDFDGTALKGLAVDPQDPTIILLTTAVSGQENGVYRSTDQGLTWSRYHTNQENEVYQHLAFAPTDNQRLYASGLALGDAAFIHFVATSSDGGATFTRHDLVLEDTEVELNLLAVDPTNPDVLYVRTLDGAQTPMDRLLRSEDGGATFETLFRVQELLGFAVSPDGQTLYAGGRQGLWRSTDGGANFVLANPESVYHSILIQHGGALYAGAAYVESHTGFAVSEDQGATFEAVVDFAEVTSLISCGADSKLADTCEFKWSEWEREQLKIGLDAGLADAGSPTGATNDASVLDEDGGAGEADETADCSCATSGGAPAPALAIALLLLAGRRRRVG